MISVDFDAKALTRGLSQFTRDEMPKATAYAVNLTAEDAQRAVREQIRGAFTLRTAQSRALFLRSVKINRDEKASSAKPEAILRIQGPETITGADPVAAMLLRHEEGGAHLRGPVEPFFIPAHATRPTPGTVVPRRLYPANLRLFDRRTADGVLPAQRGSKRRIAGVRRTFFRMGTLGIYEREGPDEIQKVWHFTTRIRLRPRLRFFATATETATARWPVHIVTALERRLTRGMR